MVNDMPIKDPFKRKEYLRSYSKEYYKNHRDKCFKWYRTHKKEHRESGKKSYQKHKEKRLKTIKEYYQNHKKEKIAQGRDWRLKNRDKINLLARKRFCEKYHTDLCFKFIANQRSRINGFLRNVKAIKAGKSMCLIGCSAEQFKKHIESLWTDGMSWNNHGYYGWHVDHIKPLISFDMRDPEQQKIAFHYTNLQPLWMKDNFSKCAKTMLEWKKGNGI